jgi:hypothetical protein
MSRPDTVNVRNIVRSVSTAGIRYAIVYNGPYDDLQAYATSIEDTRGKLDILGTEAILVRSTEISTISRQADGQLFCELAVQGDDSAGSMIDNDVDKNAEGYVTEHFSITLASDERYMDRKGNDFYTYEWDKNEGAFKKLNGVKLDVGGGTPTLELEVVTSARDERTWSSYYNHLNASQWRTFGPRTWRYIGFDITLMDQVSKVTNRQLRRVRFTFLLNPRRWGYNPFGLVKGTPLADGGTIQDIPEFDIWPRVDFNTLFAVARPRVTSGVSWTRAAELPNP